MISSILERINALSEDFSLINIFKNPPWNPLKVRKGKVRKGERK